MSIGTWDGSFFTKPQTQEWYNDTLNNTYGTDSVMFRAPKQTAKDSDTQQWDIRKLKNLLVYIDAKATTKIDLSNDLKWSP